MLMICLYSCFLFSILHRYPVISAEPEKWERDQYEVKQKIDAKKREVSYTSYLKGCLLIESYCLVVNITN